MFFLLESLQNLFFGLYILNFHDDVPWRGTIFICCARHLVDPLNLESCILQSWETSVHHFTDILPSRCPVIQSLDVVDWSSKFLFSLLCSISSTSFSTSQELTLSLYPKLFIKLTNFFYHDFNFSRVLFIS